MDTTGLHTVQLARPISVTTSSDSAVRARCRVRGQSRAAGARRFSNRAPASLTIEPPCSATWMRTHRSSPAVLLNHGQSEGRPAPMWSLRSRRPRGRSARSAPEGRPAWWVGGACLHSRVAGIKHRLASSAGQHISYSPGRGVGVGACTAQRRRYRGCVLLGCRRDVPREGAWPPRRGLVRRLHARWCSLQEPR